MSDSGGLTYDTAAIRREAGKLRACADMVSDALSDTNAIRTGLDGKIEGTAAEALDARLMEMRSQLKTLGGGMEGLSRALMAFAASLDAADEKVASMMK